ncbi:MBOAT family O-acyltransferase [Ferviditalea candida]|uniref:MBOAT family O-acyltransferase n=1 Tax=Ferviditalea candida TaxID=3108399 RepID=A0ABU5ZLU6_9BACL|nr:MBOAT family O-acyltransferase [Paenibacillaceae bacterium T2]
MLFHSPNFLIFFIAVLIPYFMYKRSRIAVLALANAVFYGFSGFKILLLFVLVTIATFCIVHGMRKENWRWLFWVGILLNLMNLAFFKYTLFLLNSFQGLTGIRFGFADYTQFSIVLPIGISFYTFELISYLIDVRRGETVPTRSFLTFWTFVSMFPHLIAGPIMRGNELIPQLELLSEKRVSWMEVKYGLYLFFIGTIKKIILADNLAPVADSFFNKAHALSGTESWIAAYLFTFQIYFDFSAYSDMALGLGYIMGVQLAQNFITPYLSSNPTEFWKRWHITLSRWIRDYIYIGLGGNRKGRARTQFNLLAAMLLSGLWHGANWTFVLWGGLHGILLVLHKWSLRLNRWRRINQLRGTRLYHILAVAVFFHITVWTWVFFRAPNFSLGWSMTQEMMKVNVNDLVRHPLFLAICGLYVLHLAENWIRSDESRSGWVWHRVPAPVRGLLYFILVLTIIYFTKGETYNFIYFQF